MRCKAAVAGQRTSDEGEPDGAGQQPVGLVRQGLPDGQVLAVVDVEGGQQQDVGGAHAGKVQPEAAPAPPLQPSTPGGAEEGGGGKRQGAEGQQVGVLGPAQSGQP